MQPTGRRLLRRYVPRRAYTKRFPRTVTVIAALLAVSLAAIATATAQTALPVNDGAGWERTNRPVRFGGLDAIAIEGDATVAVGFGIAEPFRFTALAARWDGERWNRQRVRVDPILTEVQLTDVDLQSTSRGWAVGHGFSEGGSRPVSVRWNGSSWRTVPTDALPSGNLNGVAAIRSNDVWAVGQTQVDFRLDPVLAHFDGTEWASIDVPPLEDVGPHTALSSISAEGADSIWAVGSGGVSLHYNGAQWRQVELPRVAGLLVELEEVRSFGIDDTWAVGYVSGPDGRRPVALVWNGSEWRTAQVPDHSEAQFNDVARMAGVTIAVGYEVVGFETRFYGFQLREDGPAAPLRLPPGKDALFGAAGDPTGPALWVVGSGAVGDEGKIRPYAAVLRR